MAQRPAETRTKSPATDEYPPIERYVIKGLIPGEEFDPFEPLAHEKKPGYRPIMLGVASLDQVAVPRGPAWQPSPIRTVAQPVNTRSIIQQQQQSWEEEKDRVVVPRKPAWQPAPTRTVVRPVNTRSIIQQQQQPKEEEKPYQEPE